MRIDSESISHTWFVKKKKYTYMNKYSKYTSISKQNVEIDFKKKQKTHVKISKVPWQKYIIQWDVHNLISAFRSNGYKAKSQPICATCNEWYCALF